MFIFGVYVGGHAMKHAVGGVATEVRYTRWACEEEELVLLFGWHVYCPMC